MIEGKWFAQGADITQPLQLRQAVLNRGWQGSMWFGIVPLVFVLLGLGGLAVMAWRALRPA